MLGPARGRLHEAALEASIVERNSILLQIGELLRAQRVPLPEIGAGSQQQPQHLGLEVQILFLRKTVDFLRGMLDRCAIASV